MTTSVLEQVADAVDPDARRDLRPELADPVTLAHALDPTYQVRAHLELIADELAGLERGDFDRLMLNTPPRVGKSRTAVEWTSLWWLCRHPDARVVIGCYGDDLAVKRGKAVRRLIEMYGARYGLVLERGSAAMKDWTLVTGGGVRAVGVGSSITGFDADLLLVDDPTKNRAEADSQVRRDAVYDWWSADLMSRTVNTPVVLIQTPWHPDDLRARVIAQEGDAAHGGRWRVVIMAALCEDPSADPLGRGVGDPLPHPKLPALDSARLLKHWERLRSSVAPRDWRALWQCDPKAPEGQLVTWDLLRERRCFERRNCSAPARVGVGVDPSGGGRDTAGVIAGYLGEDGRLMFTHDRSGVMSSSDWGRAACELAQETGADFIVYEANYGGDMCELVIRTAWAALRDEQPERFGSIAPYLRPVHSRRGKLLRAEPIAQQWKEDRCGTAAYLPDLESEWATWSPSSSSPGRIDASVHLAYELLPLPESGEASSDGAMMLSEANLLNWGR